MLSADFGSHTSAASVRTRHPTATRRSTRPNRLPVVEVLPQSVESITICLSVTLQRFSTQTPSAAATILCFSGVCDRLVRGGAGARALHEVLSRTSGADHIGMGRLVHQCRLHSSCGDSTISSVSAHHRQTPTTAPDQQNSHEAYSVVCARRRKTPAGRAGRRLEATVVEACRFGACVAGDLVGHYRDSCLFLQYSIR